MLQINQKNLFPFFQTQRRKDVEFYFFEHGNLCVSASLRLKIKINAVLMCYSWKSMFTHVVRTYNDHQCHINTALIFQTQRR